MKTVSAIAVGLLLQLALVSTSLADSLEARRAEFSARLDRIAANDEGLDDAARLEALSQFSLDLLLFERPGLAIVLGVPGDTHRWQDLSPASIEYRHASDRRMLDVVNSIDIEKLEPKDQLNYRLFRHMVESGVAGQRFGNEYQPVNQRNGPQQSIPYYLDAMPTRNVDDYEQILGRLQNAPLYIEQTVELMRIGLDKGITSPKVTMRDVPEQVRNLMSENPAENPMLRAFQEFPDSIPATEQARLSAAAERALVEGVLPALQQLHDFVVETYIPAARESIAQSDLPDGQAWYAYNVRQMTTTDLTAAEIHKLGLREVKRIRGEMDAVIEDSGFEGSFEEFLVFLRTDPRFFFTERQDLLVAYRDIAKRADAALPKMFGMLPRLPYGVEPVPAFSEKTTTTAYYFRGSQQAGRPGIFYANTYDLPSRPKWEMEALTLHEGVPGHHLQIALAQEMEAAPWYRQFSSFTGYIEGWGLYSESLGEDMGFYQDPYSKFGALTYEMWRAIRLVVDTGMHSMGWSRQQAIDYFMKYAGKSEHDITVEVDRYIVMPGQALAYKLGQLKILELREYAQAELGEQFDIRDFHDAVLGDGAMPLNILDERMRDWVAEQKAAG